MVVWRAWDIDVKGILLSINNVPWTPREPFVAQCKDFCPFYPIPSAAGTSPHENGSCGIYAAKSVTWLHKQGYWKPNRVVGQMHIWGKVIDAEKGIRAQYAYPKKLFVPLHMWKQAEKACRLYKVPTRLVVAQDFLKARLEKEREAVSGHR
jgi:hypothetical protein